MSLRYQIVWYSERHLLVRAADAHPSHLRAFAAALRTAPPQAMIDLTPAADSLLIHLDPASNIPAASIESQVMRVLDAVDAEHVLREPLRVVEIPLCAARDHAPDLEDCALEAGLEPRNFLERFCACTFEAAFVGFMPGFAYLSGLDERLQVARRASPRPRVPAGSVAIAGDMAGVYPFASPGGWRLIGRTPLAIFDAGRTRPVLIGAGDRVRFVQIDPARYESLRSAREQAS
jgi:KipI family sensor histidine kinase inhibitor